jgi:hypothetical protein
LPAVICLESAQNEVSERGGLGRIICTRRYGSQGSQIKDKRNEEEATFISVRYELLNINIALALWVHAFAILHGCGDYPL